MESALKIDMAAFTGITLDSRKVEPGFLFAALPGTQVDGRDYIEGALDKGARGILTLSGTQRPDGLKDDVAWIESADPRHDVAVLAAKFYGAQPAFIAAVTGTNGKTSVAEFTRQIWRALGKSAASLGTLGLKSDVDVSDIADKIASLTTPDPVQLAESLAGTAQKGVTHLALEASSHGLAQKRLDGVQVRAAAFTNLSRDHLDYHNTMEAYLEAKALLFTKLLPRGGTAVLNADIPEFKVLKALCAEHGHSVITYGEQATELQITDFETRPHGIGLSLDVLGKAHKIELPLAGAFQAHNVLAALGLVLAENPDDEALRDAAIKTLEKLKGAPGRLELVPGHPKGAAVYVDYAHTPDALITVLKAIRPHVEGRLICLFGCGGDRDPGKRAPMGRAVQAHADIGILTDDNPRGEDPASIRAQAKKDAPDAIEIAGRAEAIKHGIEILEKGDVFVIAGKGHEQGQTIKGETLPFCDKTKAIEFMKELKG